jgi:hypothetical protein
VKPAIEDLENQVALRVRFPLFQTHGDLGKRFFNEGFSSKPGEAFWGNGKPEPRPFTYSKEIR